MGLPEGAWRGQPRDAPCRSMALARHDMAMKRGEEKAPDRLPRCLGVPGNVKSAPPAGGLPFFSSRAPSWACCIEINVVVLEGERGE